LYRIKDVPITKNLDTAWSKAVKIKAGHKCEVCGKRDGVLNSHHYVGRVNRTLRWSLKNGICLCYTHHVGGKESAHQDGDFIREWFKTNRPEDYEHTQYMKNTISKRTNADKRELLKELKAYIKENERIS
jgi:hypothetical protein